MELRYILGLGMILYFVVSSIVDNHRTRTAVESDEELVKEPPPSTPQTRKAEELARDRISVMEKRKLDRFLLKDYRFTQWIGKEDMRSPESMRNKLNAMLQEMIRYLELPTGYTVEVIPDEDMTIAPDRSAECDYVHRRINFYPRSSHTPEQLGTLLCHECAHYFCFYHNMHDARHVRLNELNTDTVACLMGFSRYMLIPGSMNYLKPDQVKAVRWTLLQERKALAAGREDPAATAAKAG